MDWHESHEKVLVELSEEAQINAYLHKKAYEHFSAKNIRYQLPIIILSVISGSANFISSSFADQQQYIVLGVGGLSILTSIISSVSQFLKLGEYAEGHRIAYNSWEKYFARLNIQLKLKRENRDDANEFTLTAQSEYLRLKEMSPDIPFDIATNVRRRNKEALRHLHAPVVISGFRPVRPFVERIESVITVTNGATNTNTDTNTNNSTNNTNTNNSTNNTNTNSTTNQVKEHRFSVDDLLLSFPDDNGDTSTTTTTVSETNTDISEIISTASPRRSTAV
jgi:hypothetical protein